MTKIIDAHAHVFDTIAGFGPRGELRAIGNGRARWANGEEIALIPPGLGDRSFSAETLLSLMDDNNVEKAVLLQGSFCGFQNEYTFETARRYPERFLAAATFDPFCKQSEELLQRFLYKENIHVFKFEASSGGGLMGYHSDFAIDGKIFDSIYEKLYDANATLVLDIGGPNMPSFQPEAVSRVARRYPEMHIIICHLLAPGTNDEDILRSSLEQLALPNVWFDLSAVPWNLSPESYPYPTGAAFIELAKKIVGSDKLIWGSDAPSTLTKETYPRLAEYIEAADIFTPEEFVGVLYSNAMRAYPFR